MITNGPYPYLMRRLPGEKAVWNCAPGPGSLEVSLNVSPEEFDFIEARGFATIDGARWIFVAGASERESGFLRLHRATTDQAAT